jgi:hypothetical protein
VKIRALIGLALLVWTMQLRAIVSVSAVGASSSCGQLSMFGRESVRWDVRKNEIGPIAEYDTAIGRYVDLRGRYPLLRRSNHYGQLSFASDATTRSWIQDRAVFVQGLGRILGFDFEGDSTVGQRFTVMGWRDPFTVFLYERGGAFWTWDFRQPEPLALGVSVPPFSSLWGEVSDSGTRNFLFTDFSNQGKGYFFNPETNSVNPVVSDGSQVVQLGQSGGRLIRIIHDKTTFKVQVPTKNKFKTLVSSKLRLSFGSRSTNGRFIPVGADGKNGGEEWIVDVQSNRSYHINSRVNPTYGNVWMQGYAIFIGLRQSDSDTGHVVVFDGVKASTRTPADLRSLAPYGPMCPNALFADSNAPDGLGVNWAIRPADEMSSCIASNGTHLQVVAGSGRECLPFVWQLLDTDLSLVRDGINLTVRECVDHSAQLVPCPWDDQPQWKQTDPLFPARNDYINEQNTFPLWFMKDDVPQCLTRSGDTDGSEVFVSPCGNVAPNQIWR